MNSGKILILEERQNPSTDYFVLPALIERGVDASDIQRLSWSHALSASDLNDATVVIVRYLTSSWREAIETNRAGIRQLIYFMDDDLGDWRASQGLSLKYRYKLWRYATRHWGWLMQAKTDFWVSTDYLREKYASQQAVAIVPQRIAMPAGKRCRIFYHATASHRAEIEWLLPVMKQVLAQCPAVDFEIIGDRSTWQAYRHLPRTTVVHPLSWESYQTFISQPGRDIGLAPFLPSKFNAARSHTKMFDIERAEAHGLFAENGPWASLIEARSVSGTDRPEFRLLPMDQAQWVSALVKWAGDISTP